MLPLSLYIIVKKYSPSILWEQCTLSNKVDYFGTEGVYGVDHMDQMTP